MALEVVSLFPSHTGERGRATVGTRYSASDGCFRRCECPGDIPAVLCMDAAQSEDGLRVSALNLARDDALLQALRVSLSPTWTMSSASRTSTFEYPRLVGADRA